MAFKFNYGAFNDCRLRDSFIERLNNVIPTLSTKSVECTLYRGVRQYAEGDPSDIVAFFTSELQVALRYAKFPPQAVFVFSPTEQLTLFDLTCSTTINTLENIAVTSGIPKECISCFVSLDVTAQPGLEDDMFRMFQASCLQAGVHGFHRRTFSSTLNSSVEEFDIYRTFVPSHIP